MNDPIYDFLHIIGSSLTGFFAICLFAEKIPHEKIFDHFRKGYRIFGVILLSFSALFLLMLDEQWRYEMPYFASCISISFYIFFSKMFAYSLSGLLSIHLPKSRHLFFWSWIIITLATILSLDWIGKSTFQKIYPFAMAGYLLYLFNYIRAIRKLFRGKNAILKKENVPNSQNHHKHLFFTTLILSIWSVAGINVNFMHPTSQYIHTIFSLLITTKATITFRDYFSDIIHSNSTLLIAESNKEEIEANMAKIKPQLQQWMEYSLYLMPTSEEQLAKNFGVTPLFFKIYMLKTYRKEFKDWVKELRKSHDPGSFN